MTENVPREDMEPFKNPDLVPLEDLKLRIKTDGVTEIVSALNKRWVDERYFLHYESPKIYNDDGSEIVGAKEQWMEVVGYIIDDLKWLLNLPFYRFWSNIVFNPSILDALVSFLQEAPPFYALENFPNCPEMLELLELVRRNVLVVFARLVTNKEGPAEYMTRAFLGNLLYENFIFTIPIIFDLCQLYGRENAKVVERILTCLFTLEPMYKDDLRKTVPCLIEAFENVEKRFQNHPVNYTNEVPVLLTKKDDTYTEITLFQLEDVILYTLDITSTITVLLQNYPPVVSIFHREDFMNKIVSIYKGTIPEMYKKLNKLGCNDESMPKYIELKHRLDVTRVEILNLFRIIIFEPILGIHEKLDTVSETEIMERVESYIHLLSNAISEKEFITDYNQFYPVESDLNILSRLCPEVDQIKYDYILQSIYATIENPTVPAVSFPDDIGEAVAGPSNVKHNQPLPSFSDVSSSNEIKEPIKDSIEVACLISEIKDILNEEHEAFIETCLKHYNYDVASVINAVLEDNLPPNLKEFREMCATAYDTTNSMQGIVDRELAFDVERLNVFADEDVHVKAPEVIDVPKDYIKKNYSLVDDYNDEYDDTYDSRDVTSMTQDESLEIDSRPFTTPRVLLAKQKNETVSDDEPQSEEDNGRVEQNGRDHFIQNPEELRAKAEQRRQAARGGKTNNVIGNPRGQGQEKDTLLNRHQKNTHKANRANHNRRRGAQWKRKQGMVPS